MKHLEEIGLLPEGYQFMSLLERRRHAYRMGQIIAEMPQGEYPRSLN